MQAPEADAAPPPPQDEAAPPADAEAEAPADDSSVESEDLTFLVMMDASADRPPGATSVTVEGLQGEEVSITFEIPGAEPFKVSLPAEEVARRAAQIVDAGDEPEDDGGESAGEET